MCECLNCPRCVTCLLIIGKATHDSGIHNAIEEHGQGVDRQARVIQVLLDHAADLVIGQLHRLDGILQWTDLYLQGKEHGGHHPATVVCSGEAASLASCTLSF